MLRRVWDDIRRGENIDLYLTIGAAIGFVALNLAGVASTAMLAPLTLAVLGLLAITHLSNRRRMDELLNRQAQTLDDFFRDDFPTSYLEDLEKATELWLVGVSRTGTIKSHYERLERKLARGDRMRVLLVHPEGPALEMTVDRGYSRRDVAAKRQEITAVLAMLEDLQAGAPGRLEVRTIRHALSYGAMVVNPENSAGAIYIENYPFRVTARSQPRFILRPRDGRWYDFFKAELRTLWEAGQVWDGEGDK